MHENDGGGDRRWTSMNIGVVTNNEDPKKLGRVKLRIPGLLEPESAWALPIGTFGGVKARGFFSPPEKDAEVAVWFHQGDVDKPYYQAAHWGEPGGTPETPGPVGGYHGDNDPEEGEISAKDAPKVRALEMGRYIIIWDEREGKERLVIRDKLIDDEVEFDGHKGGITIRATSAILCKTPGAFIVDASNIVLNGRTVLASADPIK